MRFTDATGREWKLAITLGSALRVKAEVGIDLLAGDAPDPDGQAPTLLTRLAIDLMLLGRVVACLLSDQFEARGVTAADVLDSFDGQTLGRARSAFWGAMADFCRSLGRPDLVDLIDGQDGATEAAIAANRARIAAARAAIPGGMSGGLPDGSALTPAP